MAQQIRRIGGLPLRLSQNVFSDAIGASQDRSAPAQTVALQFIAIATLLILIPAMWLLPTALVLPTLSVTAFGLGIVAMVAGLLNKTKRQSSTLSSWDVSGLLVLIGCAAAILSEPVALSEWFAGSERNSPAPAR